MTGQHGESDPTRPEVPKPLADAVVDLCWRAQPYGEDAEGNVSMYLLTAGTVHRLIGAAQGAGIPAAFRVTPPGQQAKP